MTGFEKVVPQKYAPTKRTKHCGTGCLQKPTMGCAESRDTEGALTSKRIDNEIRKDEQDFANRIKMLLLGPGESGKSTLFKQMKIIQDNGGFKQDELLAYKHVIHGNCLSQMIILIKAAAKMQLEFRTEAAYKGAQHLLQLAQNSWSKEIGNLIKILWQDQGIRDAYSWRGKKFQLNDTAD